MRRSKKEPEISAKQLTEAINNAAAFHSQTKVGRALGEDRRRKLRHYTMELVKILEEDVIEGAMTQEELVMILLGGALFVQCARVCNSIKGPMIEDMMKDMLREGE